MDISASAFDIAGLIREAAATVRPNVEKKRHHAELEVVDDIARRARLVQLNQCLLNLLLERCKVYASRRDHHPRAS